jgi:protein-tyrosine phosphatase
MSRHTSARLAASGISWAEYLRSPLPVTDADFAAADRVVAVKAAEHQSIIERKFPAWRDHIEYWHVHDLDCATPPEALAQLEQEIGQLLAGLSAMAA